MTSSNVLAVVGGVLLAALVGSVVAMALHGTITGTDALTFLGGIVAIASGIISHALGVSAGASASASGANVVNANPPGAGQ